MRCDPTRPFEVTAIAVVDEPRGNKGVKAGQRFVFGAAFNLFGGRILQSAARLSSSVKDVLIFNRNVDPRTEPLRDRAVA